MNKRIKQTVIDGTEIQIYVLKAQIGIAMAQKLSG